MTFRLALSGLNAAQADLTVTANNIANTATSGFKGSRAEFAELFSVSPQGVSSNAIGNGVRVSNIAQQFTQGNIDFTDNSLDLALSGQGFFILNDSGALAYTRSGAFQVDAQGFIVNARNQRLQVYPPSTNGQFNTGAFDEVGHFLLELCHPGRAAFRYHDYRYHRQRHRRRTAAEFHVFGNGVRPCERQQLQQRHVADDL